MKKVDVLELNKVLNELSQMKYDPEMYPDKNARTLLWQKFVYAISKNMNLIKSDIDSIEKALSPSDELKKYIQEQNAIKIQYAEKDKNGQPIVVDTSENIRTLVFKDQKTKLECEYALKKLDDQYKDVIETNKKQIEASKEFLEEDCDVSLYKMSFSWLPATLIAAHMRVLMFVIAETETDIDDIVRDIKNSRPNSKDKKD